MANGVLYRFEDLIRAFPIVSPLKEMRVNQKFGDNLVPFYKDLGLMGHDGLDLRAPTGTPLYSCLNGTVGYAYTGDRDNYGYYVFLRTPVREPAAGVRCFLEVIYAHMDTVSVKTGQEVTEGQQIGTADNTGKLTTGSHLHFATRVVYIIDGQEERQRNNGYFGYSDPMLFLTATKIEELPVDRRYGKTRSFLAEKTFAFNPVTRRAFGRLPTAREVSASVYGGYTLQHLVDPAMFALWSELTYDEYRAKLRAMVSGN